jgi:hypothetical protein
MIKLSQVKYCMEMDDIIDIGKNEDHKYKIIDNKYIIDLPYEKKGEKEQFIINYMDYDYSTNKIYWWQKKIISHVLSKGFKKVIFNVYYENLDITIVKEFEHEIDYPKDIIMAGDYCKLCSKRKECKELNNAIIGDNAIGDIKNDAQLLNTLNMIQNKKKLIESIEEQLKLKLYDRIKDNGNKLQLVPMGIELSKKDINKDILKYSDAKNIEDGKLLNDDTVTVKVGKVKEILKKDKILASKVKFESVPFRSELQIDSIKSKI